MIWDRRLIKLSFNYHTRLIVGELGWNEDAKVFRKYWTALKDTPFK